MNTRRICFIAQFPPPIHGLSKAVDIIYHSTLADGFHFEKVDITDNKHFLKNLLLICRSNADLFYFTISQTKGGNFRDLVILKLLELQHKKCLIHLHGGYYRYLVDNELPDWQRKANYKAVSRLSGAIVLSDSLKPIFRDILPDERIFVIPNCVDQEYLLSDAEFEEKLATIGSRTVKHVLYLSNMIRSKGYPEVLKMAKLEKEAWETGNQRNFHFDFAGSFFEKSDEMFFFHYIKKNGLEDYVTYHGIADGDKKRDLLKKSDIFVLLTRYPKEGQPISILEAMGNGMVILTTDHAGIPDIVKDGINGYLFADISDVAQKAYNTMKAADYQKMERNGRRMVCDKFLQIEYEQKMLQKFGGGVKKYFKLLFVFQAKEPLQYEAAV